MSRPRSYGVTARQQDCLTFIRTYIATHGLSPSYQEIADAMGYTSKGPIKALIDGLVERGRITVMRYRERSIAIVDNGNAVVTDAGTIQLPASLHAALMAFCAEHDETPQAVVADAVALHLDGLEADLEREAA